MIQKLYEVLEWKGCYKMADTDFNIIYSAMLNAISDVDIMEYDNGEDEQPGMSDDDILNMMFNINIANDKKGLYTDIE